MDDLRVLEDAAVAIRDGTVVDLGPDEDVRDEWADALGRTFDAGGRAAVPGLVDGHTHPVFAGDRSRELAWKIQGLSYREIADRGGGIGHTVRATREASPQALAAGLRDRLDAMVARGATTVEAKTGYGLSLEAEARQLDAIEAVDDHPVDLVPTLLAAHDLPPERDDWDAWADAIAKEIVPELADRVEYVDVFCEDGWFDVDQSRRILEAGRDHDLEARVHADELARSGGAQLAAGVGAASADHLLEATPEDAEVLAEAGVHPVLCPATPLALDLDYADPALFLEAGAAVALGTDFNPNCWCPSPTLALQLAVHGMRMTPDQALTAATANAAASLGRGDDVGALQEGMRGDLVLVDGPTRDHLAYRLGADPVHAVVKAGEVTVGPDPT
jgi:imidazolonepropionase